MQFKALTATAMVAVFASGLVGPAHVKALSQTTTKPANATVKLADAVTTTPSTNQVVVKSGDTLSSIATQYNTTYVRLFDANSNISNPDIIYAGETIITPSANQQLPDRYDQFEADQQTADQASVSQTEAAPAVSQPVPASNEQVSAPAATAATTSTANNSVWQELAACESGGNWSIDTGNGFYGGLQFTLSSWQAMGGSGMPNQASEAEQIAIATKLQSRQGWGAWPVCSAKLGL